MLYKFTFIPNPELTERKLLAQSNASVEFDSKAAVESIFSNVVNSEYNVFVYGENTVDVFRKIQIWFDDESCILTHDLYKDIVMDIYMVCVDPTGNPLILLNALATIN